MGTPTPNITPPQVDPDTYYPKSIPITIGDESGQQASTLYKRTCRPHHSCHCSCVSRIPNHLQSHASGRRQKSSLICICGLRRNEPRRRHAGAGVGFRHDQRPRRGHHDQAAADPT
ncbi:hypothetical protein PVAP13_4KG110500 [Panicum virgatum]|uniref:Uncharacterized protein n=1 Tax=Panicum virgatum TaxID=38727 RepID=A0A8T0TQ36_PANVG|nr:hypothetical protein PVAP13_4KG110500 [Panicum virgatum]